MTSPAGLPGEGVGREAEVEHVRQHVTFMDLGTPNASMHIEWFCPQYPDDTDPQILSQPDMRHAIEAIAAALPSPETTPAPDAGLRAALEATRRPYHAALHGPEQDADDCDRQWCPRIRAALAALPQPGEPE